MAKETVVRFIDDLDGFSDAEGPVEFGLDGQMYTIDLSDKHADQLREAMAPFVAAAQPVGKMPRGSMLGSRGRVKAAVGRRDPQQAQEVRAWALRNGYEVSNRGRISREVQAAYDAAM